MRRRAAVAALSAGGLALAGIVLMVVAPWSSPRSHAVSYALPLESPLSLGLGTITSGYGTFQAQLVQGTACAWAGPPGSGPYPYLWPNGWRVRLNPAELIDPTGRVLARESVQVAVVADMGALTAGPCGTGIEPNASVDALRYELWSDGWKLGQPAMTAAVEGEFQAAVTPHGVCAWLGSASTIEAFQWPAGWTVEFDPKAVLIDPGGTIRAVEGQTIKLPGGQVVRHTPGMGTRCGNKHGHVFAVNGTPGG